MARRSGLGKGLGALIPSGRAGRRRHRRSCSDDPGRAGSAEPAPAPRATSTRRRSSRSTASVRELGVLQPVLVRPVDDGAVRADRRGAPVAGGQAGRAARPSRPWSDVADDPASLEQALVENLHREDLNPLEEAAAYQQLIEDFGLTQEQVAHRVGKSRSAITNTLRLFQLPPSVQKLVAERQAHRPGMPGRCSARPTGSSRRRWPGGP